MEKRGYNLKGYVTKGTLHLNLQLEEGKLYRESKKTFVCSWRRRGRDWDALDSTWWSDLPTSWHSTTHLFRSYLSSLCLFRQCILATDSNILCIRIYLNCSRTGEARILRGFSGVVEKTTKAVYASGYDGPCETSPSDIGLDEHGGQRNGSAWYSAVYPISERQVFVKEDKSCNKYGNQRAPRVRLFVRIFSM